MKKINPSTEKFPIGGGWIVLAVTFVAFAAQAQTAVTLTIQANQPGAVVSSNLFGIFFEEINFAGEGGIYAEMVRNRSFYSSTSANYWTLVTKGTATGTMSVDANQPLNANIPSTADKAAARIVISKVIGIKAGQLLKGRPPTLIG